MEQALWLELLLRSTVLLIAGWVLYRLGRSGGAAFRHRILCAVFALLALLPIRSMALPEIPLRFGSPDSLRAVVSVAEVSRRVGAGVANERVHWLFIIWALGAAGTCMPLLSGSWLIWRTTRRARPATQRLFKGVAVLLSRKIGVPVTCGMFQPCILLPVEAEDWSKGRMEAVLAHECAHVRRRDVAVHTLVHLVAAVWWFQPLVWLLRRKLRAESEFACDAEAVKQGLRATDYAAELLSMARFNTSTNLGWQGAAIGMVRSNDLSERVKAVLSTPPIHFPANRAYMLMVLLVSLSIASSAVNPQTRSNHSDQNQQGGSMIKRTLLSVLLTSAGLSANTIAGVVHDSTGNAIKEAKVSISSAEGDKQEALTSADGLFSLTTTGQGQYLLHIEKAGYKSVLTEYSLNDDRNIRRDFTMEGGIGGNGLPKRVRVGGKVAEQNITDKAQPVYPTAAKRAGVQGKVELEAVISKEGMPLELRVVSSPSEELSESALDAVRQWRYRPTLLNGQPVEIVTTVIVNYTLAP